MFVSHSSFQCGFCAPGIVLAAAELLDREPNPSRRDVQEAISGNLCRCTGYEPIITAVLAAADAAQPLASEVRP
jgi:carbon-monoxide dehydrogenase small subunit